MTNHALSTALAALSQSFDQHRLAQATKLQTVAPLFTPFDYLRRDEISISRILADLLDPVGAHSQGPIFLKLFLDAFGLQTLCEVSAQARVATESPTGEGRRIDILIQDKTWIIGIENKPWAKDGERQVADYLRFICNRGIPNACLIYLTDNGRFPLAISIDEREREIARERGQLKATSYLEILKWLDLCYEACRAERVKSFLFDFRVHLREAVMNIRMQKPNNPIVESLLADDTRKYLPVALQIVQQKDAIRDALLAKLYSELQEKLPHWKLVGSPMTPDLGLELRPPEAEDWFFCVELDTGPRKWCYGLKRSEPGDRKSKARTRLDNRLHERFAQSDCSNHSWLMWLWFVNRTAHDPESYSQWEDNVQPWVDMAEGTMAANLAALATELHTAAKELNKP